MKQKKLSTIRFFLEQVSKAPLFDDAAGFHKINEQWFRDRVEINGMQPDCPAVDIKEFHKMLQQPGDYEPFTCTCGNAGCAAIDFPVRCRHRADQIILVFRDPLRRVVEYAGCQFEKEAESCPAEHIFLTDCPFVKFHYRAYVFLRKDIEAQLRHLEKAYRDPL